MYCVRGYWMKYVPAILDLECYVEESSSFLYVLFVQGVAKKVQVVSRMRVTLEVINLGIKKLLLHSYFVGHDFYQWGFNSPNV